MIDKNLFNFLYARLTSFIQILSIPMAFGTLILGYLFFKPVSTYWEIPVIMIEKNCNQAPSGEGSDKDCSASEILLWAGRDHAQIRLLARSKSREILNALWANRMASSKKEKNIIGARLQGASEYFYPESDGLERFLDLARETLTKSSRHSSSYHLKSEDVIYLDRAKGSHASVWLYSAELTIVWENEKGVQDSEVIELALRWLPAAGQIRNETAQALLASRFELRGLGKNLSRGEGLKNSNTEPLGL